jgi:hypothetical protein
MPNSCGHCSRGGIFGSHQILAPVGFAKRSGGHGVRHLDLERQGLFGGNADSRHNSKISALAFLPKLMRGGPWSGVSGRIRGSALSACIGAAPAFGSACPNKIALHVGEAAKDGNHQAPGAGGGVGPRLGQGKAPHTGQGRGSRRREGFRPVEGGTCISHSRRPPRPLLAPVPCRAADACGQSWPLCGPSWPDAVSPPPALRTQAGFLATFRSSLPFSGSHDAVLP